MLDRRALLMGAPLIVATPILGFSVPAGAAAGKSEPTNASATGLQLSPAVLAAVSSSCVDATAKAHRGQLTKGNLVTTTAMIDLLQGHFLEVGFDEAFKQYMLSIDSSAIDFTNSPVVQSAYEAFVKADSSISLAEVKAGFARLMRPESLSAQLEELKTRGITHRSLTSINTLQARLRHCQSHTMTRLVMHMFERQTFARS